MSEEQPAQVHVRISPGLKRALKMQCMRRGVTEQRWVTELIEDQLSREAPDLWSAGEERRNSDHVGQR